YSTVVLCQAFCSSLRTRHIIEFCQLPSIVEWILIRKTVQHGRHPPRKTLHLPHATQARFRIAVEFCFVSVFVKLNQSTREHLNISDRKIQSLGSCRRNNVRRVSRQKQ